MIYLVIEFAAGGDLLDYIINRGGLCGCHQSTPFPSNVDTQLNVKQGILQDRCVLLWRILTRRESHIVI